LSWKFYLVLVTISWHMVSAVDACSGVVKGRPYGGTADHCYPVLCKFGSFEDQEKSFTKRPTLDHTRQLTS